MASNRCFRHLALALVVLLVVTSKQSQHVLGFSVVVAPTTTFKASSSRLSLLRPPSTSSSSSKSSSSSSSTLFSDAVSTAGGSGSGSAFLSTPWEHPTTETEQKFQQLRAAFPSDANIVEAGGWYALEKLAATNPKDELVSWIVNGLKGNGDNSSKDDQDNNGDGDKKIQFSSSSSSEKLAGLCLLLYGMGKGFDADEIDGEWDLVFTRQGTKSPSFQKWVGNKERAGFSKNWFHVSSMTFSGLVKFWKYGKVGTKVQYEPVVDAYSKSSNGKIVLRRIACTILNAFIKWWRLPGLPLPVPKKPGYLDVIYLDKDIRITRGNRGGLFVHFRPAYLDQVMS